MEGSDKRKQNPSLFFTLSLTHIALFFFFLFFIKIKTSNAADANYSSPYNPTETIALSCGSSSMTDPFSPSRDGLNWTSDAAPKFGPFPFSKTTAVTASNQDPSVPTVPYMTARLSTSQFNYTFNISSGMKFIRLHFYAASYPDHDKTNSFFSVTANDKFTLLHNFSAYLTTASTSPKLIKEFCLNVETHNLTLSFTPSASSYAFINGIEIVSMPNNIYIRGSDVDLPIVGIQGQSAQIEYNTALETVSRLNVGGNSISARDDTGMFREWSKEDDSILLGYGQPIFAGDFKIRYTKDTPAYVAPGNVYLTLRHMGKTKGINLNYNLTWSFSVDSGFNYLVRLHFCQFFYNVNNPGEMVFHIFINNQTAEAEADIINFSGGNGIPVFRDYYVMALQGGILAGKQNILVALHPDEDSETWYSDAILNGLELFKLSDAQGNLAGLNPEPQVQPSPPPAKPSDNLEKTNRIPSWVILAGSFVGFVILISLLCTFIWWRHRRERKVKQFGSIDKKDGEKEKPETAASSWWVQFADTSTTNGSSLPSDLCRHFSLAEIRAATNDFDQNLLIGVGGFGHVYKGYVGRELTTVAIKRGKSTSQQGTHEFQNEIEMLSKLRHLHLVSLIGYCDENQEMILIYDHMAHGTLRDHLYKSNQPPLSWKQRLNICIGAARGLHYLHTGAKYMIIHRDVKSTNILLDEKWVAKVSDFGLSKVGPTNVLDTHVSTIVKGTLGYLDPEYFLRQQLTEKSDVFSFGVVLFEVLCARPVLDKNRVKEEVNLAEWARLCHQRKTLHLIIDPYLKGTIAPESLERFAEIADNCLVDQGIERPSMGDVVWSLEFALQLQETAEKKAKEGCGGLSVSLGEIDNDDIPLSASLVDGIRDDLPSCSDGDSWSAFTGHVSNKSMSYNGQSISSEDPSRSMSKVVFSEIMNTDGR
ncbi:hypothetical protein NE237_006333 [Protea cynaroides]|uniref:Protein kinase domain-containing protein n=1 Tax=Protea cynaroides TaxID=273540 RepID=A0A9Q0KME0_9MAGN|nr:hypothetical protein NE237_006333 [Protea cynaroides]